MKTQVGLVARETDEAQVEKAAIFGVDCPLSRVDAAANVPSQWLNEAWHYLLGDLLATPDLNRAQDVCPPAHISYGLRARQTASSDQKEAGEKEQRAVVWPDWDRDIHGLPDCHYFLGNVVNVVNVPAQSDPDRWYQACS